MSETTQPGAPAAPVAAASVPPAAKEAAAAAAKPVDENDGLSEVAARRIDLYWSGAMVGVLALLFFGLSLVRGVSVPVVLALITAYALNPVVSFLASKGLHRRWGTLIVFVAMLLVFVGFVLYLIPVFREQADKLPDFVKRASVQVVPWIQQTFGISVPDLIQKRTSQLADEAAALLQEAGPAVARMLASFASNTARVIVTVLGLLVVPVIAFFFLSDYPGHVERFKGLIPRAAVSLVSRRFAEVDEVLSAFIRGQLTVGAILSLVYSTGLSIARLEMAIVIGLITGFGNMVPYVGTTMGILLSLVAVVLSWQGPWQLAVIAGTFLTAQLLEGLVITPRVVGHRVGLSPVAVIIAILAFAELFGFLGVLLAVPTTAVLKVVLKVLLTRYRRSRVYLGEQKA